jgi:hypothetical protein
LKVENGRAGSEEGAPQGSTVWFASRDQDNVYQPGARELHTPKSITAKIANSFRSLVFGREFSSQEMYRQAHAHIRGSSLELIAVRARLAGVSFGSHSFKLTAIT